MIKAAAPSSLRAPITNEAERAEFQVRVVFMLKMLFALSLGFLVVVLGTVISVGASATVLFRVPVVTAQLVSVAATLAIWLVVRAKSRSVLVLDVASTAATVALCWTWVYSCTQHPGAERTELLALFVITCTLALQSALVPSTAIRTAGLGIVTLAPLLVGAYRMGVVREAPQLVRQTVHLVIWCGAGIACVTVISQVTYGLRRKARSATQLGQYLLEGKIGEGGMGVVYRASHAMLRRPTAIKLISGAGAATLARFEREVQLTARLRHPNTIAIFDYGRTPDGVFYYAMEYLEGITLDTLVREQGAQPPARVVHLLLQVCGALREAHEHGLVHRDIKPANLMLSERLDAKDVLKVLDFGLVKDTASSSLSNSTDALVGTPDFMAPEAILTPHDVDHLADVYALGATAYYLLSGRHVFDGRTMVEICAAHVNLPPVPLAHRNPRVPADLDEVVLRCLAKKPEDRPQTAQEVADLLAACNLPAWTRADADEAWERMGARSEKAPRATGASTTITVALAGRDGESRTPARQD